MRIRSFILTFLFILILSGVSAAPELEVQPSDVNKTGNDSLVANEVNTFNLTFVNPGNETVYDVSPASSGLETDYISFSNNSFDIKPNSSRNISTKVFTGEEVSFNDSMTVVYSYNGSDGLESNSSLFPEVNFSVETEYRSTNVSLNVLDSSFEAGFGNESTSTFDLENVGNVTAYDINISGEDVSFDKNDLDISRDDHRLVDFSVKIPLPDENKTNSTNQTYLRTVNVSGANFESRSFDVEVFVPFREYEEDESEEDRQEEVIEQIRQIQEFCNKDENKDLALCGGEFVRTKNNTKIINNTPVYRANLSENQLEDLGNISNKYAERIQEQEDEITILQQNVRQLKDSVDNDVSQLNRTQKKRYDRLVSEIERYNDLQNQTKTIQQRRSQRLNTAGIALGVLIMISLSGVGVWKGYQKITDDDFEEFVQ